MQIYKSPGGARYVVVEGVVYCKPANGSMVYRPSMTVERYLELIAGGILTFHCVIRPIMLKKH